MSVWLPSAIRFGIPYDVFWGLNPKIMNIYQEAYRKDLEERQQVIDYEAWLHGQYQMMSIGAVMSKKCKYPKRPITMQEQSSLGGEERFLLWIDDFNRKFDGKQGGDMSGCGD